MFYVRTHGTVVRILKSLVYNYLTYQNHGTVEIFNYKKVTYEKKIYRQHKKAKAKGKSARDHKNLCILPENSADDVGSRRALLVLCIYL